MRGAAPDEEPETRLSRPDGDAHDETIRTIRAKARSAERRIALVEYVLLGSLLAITVINAIILSRGR